MRMFVGGVEKNDVSPTQTTVLQRGHDVSCMAE